VTKTLFPNPDNAEEISQAAAGSLGVTKGKGTIYCFEKSDPTPF